MESLIMSGRVVSVLTGNRMETLQRNRKISTKARKGQKTLFCYFPDSSSQPGSLCLEMEIKRIIKIAAKKPYAETATQIRTYATTFIL